MPVHRKVGYAYLRDHLNTGAFEPERPARVYPVHKFVAMPQCLQVPEASAPGPDAAPLEHLLFALKHEYLDLQAALLALKKIEAAPLVAQFSAAPSSRFLQQACFLWEIANEQALEAPLAKNRR